MAGDVVPSWGPDGQLESQTLPGGVRLTIGYDTARVPVSRTYTRVSDGVVVASDIVVENHRGQWIRHTSTDRGELSYTYDRLGRLVATDQRDTSTGACASPVRVRRELEPDVVLDGDRFDVPGRGRCGGDDVDV